MGSRGPQGATPTLAQGTGINTAEAGLVRLYVTLGVVCVWI